MRFFPIKGLLLALLFLVANDVFNEFSRVGTVDWEIVTGKAIIRLSTLLTVWIFLTLSSVGNQSPPPQRKQIKK